MGLLAVTEIEKRGRNFDWPHFYTIQYQLTEKTGLGAKPMFLFLEGLSSAKKKKFKDLLFKDNLITGFYWKGVFLSVLSEMEGLWWLEENKQQGKLR